MVCHETLIAKGIDWWLREEVLESSQGRNKIRDNYVEVRQSYSQPEERSSDVAKTGGHYVRFNQLVAVYPEEYGSDYFIGKVLHHALMFVSGNFRTQCHLQAATQEEYNKLRFGRRKEYNGAAGVDILSAVHLGIEAFRKFGTHDLQDVVTSSMRLNQDIFDANSEIFRWHTANPGRAMDGLREDEGPVPAVKVCQRLAICLAAGHVRLASQLRDGLLEAVPFLEPKSITDASEQPLYLFRTKPWEATDLPS
jgi:hypothetical protein